MTTGIEPGVLGERIKNSNDFSHELVAETIGARVIPSGGLVNIVPNFRPYDDAPTHDLERERRRVFISSRGTDEFGSAR
jgi:hypothetical protein